MGKCSVCGNKIQYNEYEKEHVRQPKYLIMDRDSYMKLKLEIESELGITFNVEWRTQSYMGMLLTMPGNGYVGTLIDVAG